MAMTKAQKNAINKLHKKYNYISRGNKEGIIIHQLDTSHLDRENECPVHFCDVTIAMKNKVFSDTCQVALIISDCIYNGKDTPEEEMYEVVGNYYQTFTLEEIDLLHTIAHEIAETHDWEGQIKELRAAKKK